MSAFTMPMGSRLPPACELIGRAAADRPPLAGYQQAMDRDPVSQSSIRIGLSGWDYPRWQGDFYPPRLAARKRLAYVAEHFDTVEVNGSFYALQRPTTYQRWYDETPDDFLFALKGGRFITHLKRLRDVEAPLGNFFASGLLALGPKLGPILWQLPEMLLSLIHI